MFFFPLIASEYEYRKMPSKCGIPCQYCDRRVYELVFL